MEDMGAVTHQKIVCWRQVTLDVNMLVWLFLDWGLLRGFEATMVVFKLLFKSNLQKLDKYIDTYVIVY